MPAQDPITDPHETIHVPYHEASNRFGNGFILPGHDGDPPDAYYTSNDFVKVADLPNIDFDLYVTQPFTVHQFIFKGSADPALSDYPDFVANDEQVVAAVATSAVAPTGSDVTINFQYNGNDVLSTPVHLVVGGSPGTRYYSTAIAIPLLTQSGSIDFVGSLVAVIVATDSGNTAANIAAALITQRVP